MVSHEEILNRLSTFELATAVKVVSSDKFVFDPDFRKYCEDNVCGNYNANYTCPPYCGTPEQMKEHAMQFNYCVLVQSTWKYTDIDSLIEGKKRHNVMSEQMMKAMADMGLTVDAMMAGCCAKCDDGCRMKSGQPCKQDYKIFSCASAYCLDVEKLCQSAGIDYMGTDDNVHFFSMLLFDKK